MKLNQSGMGEKEEVGKQEVNSPSSILAGLMIYYGKHEWCMYIKIAFFMFNFVSQKDF